MRERVNRLTHVVLQVETTDRWVWKLDRTQRYTVKSADNYLNRIPTKDNLLRRKILANVDTFCSVDCGFMEDCNHFLFFQCDLYGRLWPMISC